MSETRSTDLDNHIWTKWETVIGGQTSDGDYCVARNGVALGRVHRGPVIENTAPFLWVAWVDGGGSGRADGLGAALRACQQAIGSKPVPQHIQRKIGSYTKSRAELRVVSH